MKYMGSKARLAKKLLEVMLPYRADRPWVEPFVGGGNMIENVTGRRLGADSDPNTIKALVAIRDNLALIPVDSPGFSEEDYKRLRQKSRQGTALSPVESFAGFAYSYGGKWLGGWRRDNTGDRDYIAEAWRNAAKQSPKLQGVELSVCSYDEMDIPPNSLIYCDPPYAGATQYKGDFDHENFFLWCARMHRQGHLVFVSEYQAPPEFKCVFESKICSSLEKNTGSKTGVERLFTLQDS